MNSKEQWSTRDKIVFSKWRTYNKVKQMSPLFQFGTAPQGYGDNYYIENRANNECIVIQKVSSYMSLKNGYFPGRKDIVYRGTLRECKKWLIELIDKCYDEQEERLEIIVWILF
jgi:hypothetical protein